MTDDVRLTTGAFARAAGLTPKAVRLYDELGLLVPAEVDPHNGYRYYVEAQLGRARTIARLRLIGMPLAEIREVVDAPKTVAADRLAAYWRQVQADVATRGRMVASLVDELATGQPPTRTADTSLSLLTIARGGTGGRPTQQDAHASGTTWVAIADGTGPDDVAAPAAVRAFGDEIGHADVGSAFAAASRAVTASEGSTTLTGVKLEGSQASVGHVGDTRLYVVRDSEAEQITRDHTMAAQLIAEGRLTPDEARSHPHSALLNRALAAHRREEPDVSTFEVSPGTRLALTTDGVHSVVPPGLLERLITTPDADAVGDAIVRAVEGAGAPDNWTVLVAEVIDETST